YAFGLTSLFCIPLFPMIIFGLVYSSGGFDWMPVISTLLPMLLGIILGNLDKQFAELFGPGLNVLIPWLGWSIGQGTNV
ncbi:2-keto-3-deoxygluconate permease, partial [Aerococcus sp. UMB8623]